MPKSAPRTWGIQLGPGLRFRSHPCQKRAKDGGTPATVTCVNEVGSAVEAFAEAFKSRFGGFVAAECCLVVPIDGLLNVFADAGAVLIGLAEAVHGVGVAGSCTALVPAEGFDVVLFHS